jgi:hypothetical protein
VRALLKGEEVSIHDGLDFEGVGDGDGEPRADERRSCSAREVGEYEFKKEGSGLSRKV